MNSLCQRRLTRQFSLCCLFITIWGCLLLSPLVRADIVTGMVGHWPLDADQGLFAEDISGYARHGLIHGSSIAWQPDGGRVGGALSFDGHSSQVADFVEIPMEGMQPQVGSVLFWAKLNSNPQSPETRYCFGHTTLPPWNNRIQLYFNNGDRQLDLGLGDSHARRTGIHTLEVGQWTHIALTWDKNIFRVYIDGGFKVAGVYSGLSEFQAVAHLGNNGGSNPNEIFHGELDELYLYTRALSQSDIQSLLSDPPELVNRPPLVEAGSNQTLRLPDNTITLNGTVTDDDPDNTGQLQHTWSLLSGPATVFFSPSADSLDAQVTFSQTGTYVLQLQAWGDLAQEGSDTLTVKVLSADAPDPSTGLVINEFMAGNSYVPYTNSLNITTQVNGSDVNPDWIEIHNPKDSPISLAGWSLTDDEQDLGKWPFPDLVLDAGDYLIVFASSKQQSDTPNNFPYQDERGYFHTNFSLSLAGEYLGLVSPSGTVVHAYAPYPPQRGLLSYGLGMDGTAGFLKSATAARPGAQKWNGFSNSVLYNGAVAEITFSQARGFYHQPLAIRLDCATPQVEIHYTLDGSQPTANHGRIYNSNQSITITTTTCLRAAGFKDDYLSSPVSTHTYVFVDHVKNQTRPSDYPREWTSESGFIGESGDYTMDPEITEDPAYKNILSSALMSIPTVSIVTDKDHLFDDSQGIYMKPQNHGVLWERPVSLEVFDPNGTLDYQVDCGLRIQGGHTRLPSKNPKHSFRVLFKAGYGAGKMRTPLFGPHAAVEFDNIVLRAGGNQSWLHHNTFKGDNRGRAQFIRDQWAKDVQKAMGGLASGNIYAHLYINGLYWGLYNPTERPDAAFAATYLGGEKEQYDALNSGEVLEGDSGAYNVMFSAANAGLTSRTAYEAFAERLDIPAFIDYMMIHQFGGDLDWDHHNWYAFARREPIPGPFYFASWDSEFIFINDREDGVQANLINLN
ncbi:LamG-like jellyroll fold domain-containing protein, partial [Planctomycetota bacterium]